MAGFVGISLLTGGVGSVFTASAIPEWYATLARPAFAPPNWLFGPVWTLLYILMGTAAYIVWKKRSSILENAGMLRAWRWGMWLFFVQLGLNTLWSVIFFGLRSPGAALVEIVFLWLAILATVFAFSKVSKPAAWLLAPYILWVTFAAYLNYAIWTLN